MRYDLLRQVAEWNQKRRWRKVWHKVTGVLACVVALCTIYALILPAIAMEEETYCGIEVHQHEEFCYEQQLICEMEGSVGELDDAIPAEMHVHDESYYEKALVCGKVEHEHSLSCYSAPNADVESSDTWIHTASETDMDGSSTIEGDRDDQITAGDVLPENPVDVEETFPDVDAFARLVSGEENALAFMAEGDLDFGSWITGVTLQHRPNDWSEWQPVTDGKVSKNDNLRFKMEYTVPGGQLSESNSTITYQLPNSIKLENAAEGTVKNDAGQTVGTYKIDRDGKVSITFTDDYAKNNQNGQQIHGFVSFETKVSSITSDNGKIDLLFNDSLDVKITVTDEETQKADLNVQKTASEVDHEAGTVKYIITVKSTNGTGGPVTLKDIMTNIGLEGEVTVSGADSECTVQKTDNGFDIILPQMDEGDIYTITYMAKLPDLSAGTINVKNKVSVESVNKDNGKIEDSAQVDTRFEQTYIKKTGAQQPDGKIKWKIIVNEGKNDIGGWTLTDTFNGKQFTEAVNISPALNGQDAIKLPYTFPAGCKDTYIITYETDADKAIGQGQSKNTAELKPGEGPGASSGEIGVGNWDPYNPLTKTADSLVDNGDKTATVRWTLNIDANKGPIAAPWVYTDELQNGQWFTGAQLKALKAALDESLKNNGLSLQYTITANEQKEAWPGQNPPDGIGSEVSFDQIQDSGKYKVYKIKFDTPLEKEKSFALSYESMAPLGEGKSELTFQNKADINNQVWSNGQIKYKPLVRKEDQNGNNADNSNHNYYDEVLDKNGTLKWLITVSVPEGYNGGDLTVTEKLPEGVDLTYLEILADGVFSAMDITESGSHQKDGFTIITAREDQIVTVTIPENLAKKENLREIRFAVRGKIQEGFQWPTVDGKPVALFKNEVEVISKDGKTHGTDSQTQTITKDETKEALKKSHTHADGKPWNEYDDNIIPYFISVNPNGRDLLEGEDTLTLVDVLEHSVSADHPFNAALVPGSVKVYKQNADGSKGEQIPVKYTYKIGTGGNQWNPTNTYTLEIIIPDSTPLLVEYQYKISSTVGWERQLTNIASLKGYTTSGSESKDQLHIKVTESSAGANIQGVSIYKVDEDNNSVALQGAEFKLYRYDRNSGNYVSVPDEDTVYTAGFDGLLSLENLSYNTAYKLEEVKAPEGYILSNEPYYFYIENPDKTKYPVSMPGDFTGIQHAAGDVIYYANTKNSTSIEVDKKWFRHDGTPMANKAGSIILDLYQVAKTAGAGIEGGSGEDGSVTLTPNTSGKNEEGYVFHDGPITQTYPIGTKVHYQLSYKWYQWVRGDIKVNGITYSPAKGSTSTIAYYEFDVTVGDNTQVALELYDPGSNGWALTVLSTEAPPDSGPDTSDEASKTKYGTYTISHKDNWHKIIEDLPRMGVVDGKTVYYTYYVKEVQNSNYTTEYENNGGISSGVITIKNTEIESPSYELPATGGPGILLYTFSGIALIAGALMYEIYRRRGGMQVS